MPHKQAYNNISRSGTAKNRTGPAASISNFANFRIQTNRRPDGPAAQSVHETSPRWDIPGTQ